MREEHMAAVYTAKTGVEEAYPVVATLATLAEGNLGLIAAATGGGDSGSEAGQEATRLAALFKEKCDEMDSILDRIVANLDEYAGTW